MQVKQPQGLLQVLIVAHMLANTYLNMVKLTLLSQANSFPMWFHHSFGNRLLILFICRKLIIKPIMFPHKLTSMYTYSMVKDSKGMDNKGMDNKGM